MPAGMQVSEYDILCVRPGQTWASAPLRRVVVPVTGVTLDVATNTGLRGVAVQEYGGPNPITGRGTIGKCLDNQTDFTGNQLGVVESVGTFTIIGLENLDNVQPSPPPIIFRILTGTAGAMTVRFTGVVAANVWEWHEPLVQVSGVNWTQIEFHARVDTAALPAAGRVGVLLAVNIRQCDDAQDRTWMGLNVVAGGP